MRRGYITVFLSLSLTLILSLVFTVIEGARISAIRMKFECVADIGMNSVLAEYHRELLKQYDLLFVDTSMAAPIPILRTRRHICADTRKKTADRGREKVYLGEGIFWPWIWVWWKFRRILWPRMKTVRC